MIKILSNFYLAVLSKLFRLFKCCFTNVSDIPFSHIESVPGKVDSTIGVNCNPESLVNYPPNIVWLIQPYSLVKGTVQPFE